MITGGNPPAIFMDSSPASIRDLTKQGLGFPLTKFFDEIGATDKLPRRGAQEHHRRRRDHEGAGRHAHRRHGLLQQARRRRPASTRHSWKSLDDFFADFDKIKAAGFIPLAQGGNKFQEAYLLQAIIAAEAGPDIYNKFYGENPDKAAIDSPEMRKALDRFRQISQHVDPGSPNREWNDTTNLVITGKALMQIHGDWMKGEFKAAGKTLGEDFDCINIPGTKALVVTSDAFGFLNTNNPETLKSQEDFAKDAVDPVVNAAFNAHKGATPDPHRRRSERRSTPATRSSSTP